MPQRVLMMELNAPAAFSAPAKRADLYHRVLEQIQAVPGVESAGIIGDMFIGNPGERLLTIEGGGGTVSDRLRFDEVSPDFFKTLGTPLLRGRFFSFGDGPEAPRVAIVNDALARRAWPGRDPLGRRFKLGPRDSDRPWYTVVGVVGDMRRQAPEREPILQIFEPLAQNPPRGVARSIEGTSRRRKVGRLRDAGNVRVAGCIHSNRMCPVITRPAEDRRVIESRIDGQFPGGVVRGAHGESIFRRSVG